MLASSVRIDAPGESQIGTVVFGEDRARVIFVDLHRLRRRLAEVVDRGRVPRIGRIGERYRTHALASILNGCSHARATCHWASGAGRQPFDRLVNSPIWAKLVP